MAPSALPVGSRGCLGAPRTPTGTGALERDVASVGIKLSQGRHSGPFYLLSHRVEMQHIFDKYRLMQGDAQFARNCDAQSYAELLAEMRGANDYYARKPYRMLQKLAARMWAAAKEYRAEQKLARTQVGETTALRAHALRQCPVYMQMRTPADEDGHCSYTCASGGGAVADLSGNGL